MPPTLPSHILMSYKDTLSPLSPSPLDNCENHNNQLSGNPLCSYCFCNMLQNSWGFQNLPSFWLHWAVPFPRHPPPKIFGLQNCGNVFKETFIISHLPLETALAAILQAWSGKTEMGNFTIREWHLHVYLHLFTAVAEWKQPQVTEQEDLKGHSTVNALKLYCISITCRWTWSTFYFSFL